MVTVLSHGAAREEKEEEEEEEFQVIRIQRDKAPKKRLQSTPSHSRLPGLTRQGELESTPSKDQRPSKDQSFNRSRGPVTQVTCHGNQDSPLA